MVDPVFAFKGLQSQLDQMNQLAEYMNDIGATVGAELVTQMENNQRQFQVDATPVHHPEPGKGYKIDVYV